MTDRSTPSPEPDEGRSDNIDVSDHHDMKVNYDGSADENKVRSEATSIVLLRNMVGPGEVDDTLQHETADECSKYGKVERCLIFEVMEPLLFGDGDSVGLGLVGLACIFFPQYIHCYALN